MTPFAFIMIASTFFNCLNYKNKTTILIRQTALTVFVCSFVNVGYFLDTDLISIDYYQAALIFQLFVSFMCVGAKKKNKIKIERKLLLYIASMFITIISLIVYPSSNALVTGAGGYFEDFMVGKSAYFHPEFTKFTVFFFAIAVILAIDVQYINRNFDRNAWQRFAEIETKYTKILLTIILIELILKNIFHSSIYATVITFLFGRGTSVFTSLRTRGSVIVIQGLSREGSHLSYCLMLVIVLLFIERQKGRKNTAWLVIAVFEMLFTGAITSIWCFACLYLMYIVFLTESKRTQGHGNRISRKNVFILFLSFIGISLVAVILLFSGGYASDRLNDVFVVLQEIGSYDFDYFRTHYYLSSNQTRIYSILFTLTQWIARPLFGLGLGTTFCYSDTVLTLSEIGLVGFIMFFRYYFDYNRDDCVKSAYQKCAIIWIVCNFFGIFHTRLFVAGDIIIIICALRLLFEKSEITRYRGGI